MVLELCSTRIREVGLSARRQENDCPSILILQSEKFGADIGYDFLVEALYKIVARGIHGSWPLRSKFAVAMSLPEQLSAAACAPLGSRMRVRSAFFENTLGAVRHDARYRG